MATRRDLLRWAGVVPAAGLLAGCGPRESAVPPRPGTATLLHVETADGLALIDAANGRVVADARAGVATWDGSRLATAEPVRESGRHLTRVAVRDAASHFDATVDGALVPRVVAPSGDLIALTAAQGAGASAYRPAGRDSTTIVVADRDGERCRFTVPGCVEPEAFAAQGDTLFVLDYLPPLHPDRYRVRALYLATGQLEPLLTREKTVVPDGAEEEMRGLGRQAVFAPGQQYLFTLYTHQPDHEHTRDLVAGARAGAPDVHAFVHTLSLDQFFAYCIDLPAPFGQGPPEGHAIALGPRGQHPIVVDAGGGVIARLDGRALTVALTAAFPTRPGQTHAAVAANGEICFIGSGRQVHMLRTATLTPVTTWTAKAPVQGLATGRDGLRVWLGQPGGVVALDATSGREVARVPVDGLVTLRHVL